jgi:uncharacterized protein
MCRVETFEDLPRSAAWVHEGARQGLETVFIRRTSRGWRLSGHTTAVEAEAAWTVRYDIGVDASWRTRAADVWSWSTDGRSKVSLRHDGAGRWTINGISAARLDGCMDVDLESSACTNAFPVHRRAAENGPFEAPAAYVRVAGAEVTRLEQSYDRDPTEPVDGCWAYRAPQFEFACRIQYDQHGLVLHYPGIARRVL